MTLLAYDRVGSARTFDRDGRLRVARTPISKANICEYLGREIPGYKELGLEPEKRYRMLRDPVELAKAVDTFNSIPILDDHIPTSAVAHPREKTIGATMNNAVFEYPFLKNDMVFFDKEPIDGIETGEKKQLSSAYQYTPDMTPGVYEGQPYDGRITNIVGNHVALVKEGRAGPDVLVNDSARGLDAMPEGARAGLNRFLGNKSGHSSGHGRGGWNHTALPNGEPGGGQNHDEEADGLTGVVEALRPFMNDLSDDEIRAKASELIAEGNEETSAPGPGAQDDETEKEDDRLTRMEEFMRREGFTPEQASKCREMCARMLEGKGMDEDVTTPNSGMPSMTETKRDDEERLRHAMDSAARKAVLNERARITALETAKQAVRPLVGDVYGLDSAQEIYRYALSEGGYMAMDSLKMINEAGLKALVDTQIRKQRPTPIMATDSAKLPFTPPRQLGAG